MWLERIQDYDKIDFVIESGKTAIVHYWPSWAAETEFESPLTDILETAADRRQGEVEVYIVVVDVIPEGHEEEDLPLTSLYKGEKEVGCAGMDEREVMELIRMA